MEWKNRETWINLRQDVWLLELGVISKLMNDTPKLIREVEWPEGSNDVLLEAEDIEGLDIMYFTVRVLHMCFPTLFPWGNLKNNLCPEETLPVEMFTGQKRKKHGSYRSIANWWKKFSRYFEVVLYVEIFAGFKYFYLLLQQFFMEP
jgi:hypothetical protein